jgi:5-methyltetrahydropteroyltriglutamate--homocysteine methyltransferase
VSRSVDRIRTTLTGSLPRPAELTSLMFARQEGRHVDDGLLAAAVDGAVHDVVRRQLDAGVDIVSDGEMSKPGFVNYIGDRLTGFGEVGPPWSVSDMDDMPQLVMALYGGPGGTHINMPRCIGEVTYSGTAEVDNDIARLRAALGDVVDAVGFIPSTSPGCLTMAAEDGFYGDYETYLGAVADAMRTEYRAIIDGGFILQLDCPDIPMGHHTTCWMSDKIDEMGFERYVDLHIDALNSAVSELPADRIRMHICWGNYAGPHHKDIPLSKLLGSVLRAHPSAISFEGANPRHEHEWEVLTEADIPDDKVLIPGVIDTKTNVVEHPRLVAQRIERYAGIVGRERVVPGTDCGFGTFVGFGLVEPEVTWLKLGALAEGAAMASDRLW